jgi:hypothetical protein
MPGLQRGPPRITATDLPATGPAGPVARAAVLAAFVALVVHTMAYAGFFEDPLTWALLAIGASLAAADLGPRTTPAPPPGRSASGDPVRAPA